MVKSVSFELIAIDSFIYSISNSLLIFLLFLVLLVLLLILPICSFLLLFHVFLLQFLDFLFLGGSTFLCMLNKTKKVFILNYISYDWKLLFNHMYPTDVEALHRSDSWRNIWLSWTGEILARRTKMMQMKKLWNKGSIAHW